MKTKYKFIHFEKLSDDPEVWVCNNNRSIGSLGRIEYYAPWRQWVFSAVDTAVFNDQCLKDIAHFIGQFRKYAKVEVARKRALMERGKIIPMRRVEDG